MKDYYTAKELVGAFKSWLGEKDVAANDVYRITARYDVHPVKKGKYAPLFYWDDIYNLLSQLRNDKEKGQFKFKYPKPDKYPEIDYTPAEENMNYCSDECLKNQGVYESVFPGHENVSNITEEFKGLLNEKKKKVVKNDKGEIVPDVCPECGSKVGLYIQGEPVYLCSNKKCKKYFGTMPFPKSLEKELKENKKMKKKKVFLTEEQYQYIKESMNEGKFPVDPNKVLVVKKFLDDNFQKGGIAAIGEDGYPKTIAIVALKGTDGSLLKNMDDKQLFYMLQDKFQHLYDDFGKRDKLLKQIIKDWYKDKISKNGMLTVNLI